VANNEPKTDRLPLVALILLTLYNVVFFAAKIANGRFEWLQGVFLELRESSGFFTLLEILGVAGVFVDLVVRYDKLGEDSIGRRRMRLILTAFLVIAFFFKLFINYIDSAYLEPKL
jgi:hypothetical protein